jgi:hypothetical protein
VYVVGMEGVVDVVVRVGVSVVGRVLVVRWWREGMDGAVC